MGRKMSISFVLTSNVSFVTIFHLHLHIIVICYHGQLQILLRNDALNLKYVLNATFITAFRNDTIHVNEQYFCQLHFISDAKSYPS